MPSISLEQALFYRPDREPPQLKARSAGFDSSWVADAEDLLHGFGERRHGLPCPLTVFARPLNKGLVAIVRAMDDRPGPLPRGMRFHFLLVERKVYESYIRDPFQLAEKVPPVWEADGVLPTLTLPEDSVSPRTLEQVQGVLKRVKASALREGEDPEAPDFERTAENSESPALLGGAQILVDGGRLVFERRSGDLALVSGLWLLLPEATRSRLWPTTFAFSSQLEFDVLVLPQLEEEIPENYTTEDQASAYPDGAYELALQCAAESGDQRDLDAVFRKRDGHHTLRLAITLVLLVSGVVLFSRWLDGLQPPPHFGLPIPIQKAAAASGIVAAGEPWTDLGMLTYWQALTKEKNAFVAK